MNREGERKISLRTPKTQIKMPPGETKFNIQPQLLLRDLQKSTNSTKDEDTRSNAKARSAGDEEDAPGEGRREPRSVGCDPTPAAALAAGGDSPPGIAGADPSRRRRRSPPPPALSGPVGLLALLTLALTPPAEGGLLGILDRNMLETGVCADPQLPQGLDLARFSGVWYQVEQEPNSYLDIKECIRINYTWDGTEIRTETRGLDQHGDLEDQMAIISQVMPVDPTQPRPYLQVRLPGVPPVPYHIVRTDYDSFACVYSCFDFVGLKMEVSSVLSRTPLGANSTLEACRGSFGELGVDLSRMLRVVQGPDCWYGQESNSPEGGGGGGGGSDPPGLIPPSEEEEEAATSEDTMELMEGVLQLAVQEVAAVVDGTDATIPSPEGSDAAASGDSPSGAEQRWEGERRLSSEGRGRGGSVEGRGGEAAARPSPAVQPSRTTETPTQQVHRIDPTDAEDQVHQEPRPTEVTPICTCTCSSVQTNSLALFTALLFCYFWGR